MARVELQLLRADGTPAADALVGVAEAPVALPDLGLVADAAGRMALEVPVAGRYLLSVWLDGREQRLGCELGTGAPTVRLQLPA